MYLELWMSLILPVGFLLLLVLPSRKCSANPAAGTDPKPALTLVTDSSASSVAKHGLCKILDALQAKHIAVESGKF